MWAVFHLMDTHNRLSSTSDFPPFQIDRKNYNITSTGTAQNIKIGVFRSIISISIDKMALYEDDDKWIFDCLIYGERHVYWENVGTLRKVLDRKDVIVGDYYHFLIDDTDGKLYTTPSNKLLWAHLQPVENGEQYRSYMKPTPTSEDEYFCIQHNPTTTNMPSVQNDPKIGEIVQEQLIPLIQKAHGQGLLTMQDMHELQNWTLSSFPVLRRESDIPEPELRRYYAAPVMLFGERYRVCNHWYPKNKPEVLRWLKRLNGVVTPFPEFRNRWNGYNITATEKTTDVNHTRCWVNLKKMAGFADDDKWIFDCLVDKIRRVYWTEVKDLKNANFRRKSNDGREDFYLDYTHGCIYSTAYSTDNEPVLHLNEVRNGDEYRLYMKRSPKDGADK